MTSYAKYPECFDTKILKDTMVEHPVTGKLELYKVPEFKPFPEKSKVNLNEAMEKKRHKFFCQCGKDDYTCPLGDW